MRAWGLIALLALGGCTAAAAPQAVGTAQAAPATNGAIECRQMKVPGSNMPQRVCQTKAQWARFDRQSQQGVDDYTRDRAQQTGVDRPM